jgi:DNA polymerase-1
VLTIPVPAADATINVVRTYDDADQLSQWLIERQDEHLGLDLETNAVYPWREGFRTRCVQISDEHTSWVIPTDDEVMATEAADAINAHDHWVAHFSENDIAFAHRGLRTSFGESPIHFGQKTPHVADSQVVLAMFDPRTVTTRDPKNGIDPRITRLKGLKDNSVRLLGPALKQAEEALDARFAELAPVGHRQGKQRPKAWGFANIPNDDPAYLVYAGLDPIYCLRLFRLCQHNLKTQGRWARARAALVEQWMLDTADVQYGMQLDAPYVLWLSDQLRQSIDDNAKLLQVYGIGESGMGPAVGKAFSERGVQSPVVKDGKPSWDKTAMNKLKEHEHPKVRELATAISTARRSGKFKSAYVDPMVRAVVHGDGAMHPSTRAIGTVTTRMSAQGTESAGPVQQLPKKDTRVRGAIRARRGCVLVTADFEQGEPFTMAALSGDLDYLRDLEAGDINSRIAELVFGSYYDRAFGKTAGTVHYHMRQNGKGGWLLCCYGGGAPKLEWTLQQNLSAELIAAANISGESTLRTWHSTYPRFWQYADECNQQTFIRLDSGHVVPLWDRFGVAEDGSLFARARPSRLGLNAATQGTQADLLKLAMHRLWHWGWGWAFRFALHDELMLEVPEWMAEHARQVLEAAMTITYRGVTLRCDAVIEGRTWMPQPEAFTLMDLPDELED